MEELLQTVVDTPSPTGDEHPLIDFLLQYGRKTLDLPVIELQEGNLLFGAEKPKIVMCTHIDTVVKPVPFSSDETYVYGSGVIDGKVHLVTMLETLCRLISSGQTDVGLLVTVGEIGDHRGMKALTKSQLDPELVIVGKPTNLKLAKMQKGLIYGDLTCVGSASHAGSPEGVSALNQLASLCLQLSQTDWEVDSTEYGPVTFNWSLTTPSPEIIPGTATASLMLFTPNPCRQIMEKMVEVVGEKGKLQFHHLQEPIHLDVIEGMETMVASFTSDLPCCRFTGKRMMLGPGDPSLLYQTERLKWSELHSASDRYFEVIQRYLSEEKEGDVASSKETDVQTQTQPQPQPQSQPPTVIVAEEEIVPEPVQEQQPQTENPESIMPAEAPTRPRETLVLNSRP